MIDTLPAAAPSSPAVNLVAAPSQANPGSPAAGAASVSTGGNGQHSGGSSGALPMVSFASTLQNRLKSMAIHKAPVMPKGTDATAKLPAKPPAIPDLSSNIPLAATIKSVAANDDADAVAGDRTKPEDEKEPQTTAALTDLSNPPPALPLVLNTLVTATPVAAAEPAVVAPPIANPPPAKDGASHDAATAAPAAVADRAPAAILAAAPEKTDVLAANADGQVPTASFAEALRNSSAHAAINQAQSHLAAPAAIPAREVAAPVASAHWASDVGNQLSWMVNQNKSNADLVLNPPQLGRIEVSISINGDQASASFVSANPEVRDALQGSLPRLREVLADAGIFLGQANVGAESFRQGGNGTEKGGKSTDDSFSSSRTSLLGSINGAAAAGTVAHIRQGTGLIDLFA